MAGTAQEGGLLRAAALLEGGGKGRAVFLCSGWRWRHNRCAGRPQWTRVYNLMVWPRGLEGSPGHPLSSVALETKSVLPAKSCWVSLVKDLCIQDIPKSINLTFPGNCTEGGVTDL